MGGWILLLMSPAIFVVADASAVAGPFEVILTDMKPCPDPTKGIAYNFKVMKVTRKKVVILANVTFDIPVDDNLNISVNMAKQTSQGWKDNYFILEVPKACTGIKKYVPGLDHEISTHMKLPSGHCPYPVGNYSMTVSLNVDVGGFPMFPYGKYLTKVNLMKNRVRVFCILSYADIVPKKSG